MNFPNSPLRREGGGGGVGSGDIWKLKKISAVMRYVDNLNYV